MTMPEIAWSCAPIVWKRDEIHELHEVDYHNHILKTTKSTHVNERVETLESNTKSMTGSTETKSTDCKG